jgi:hypothetical protein
MPINPIITVNANNPILKIQEEFNHAFPYLKIEFLFTATKEGSMTRYYVHSHQKTLRECRTVHSIEKLVITATMTVADLEHYFNQIYGLRIQLFRKSGKLWLETTVTDGWTLEEQNGQGEALSKNK